MPRVRPGTQAQGRDPEMHQTRKGKQWYFGMKIHIGADVDSGAVHSVAVTAANEADINALPKLLRAEDEVIFGDAGYTSEAYKQGSRKLGIRWCVQDKRKPGQNLSASQKKRNRKHSSIRARVVFRVIKRQFGFTKTRYRGLMKNTVQVNMRVGLASVLAAQAADWPPEGHSTSVMPANGRKQQKQHGNSAMKCCQIMTAGHPMFKNWQQ